MASAHELARHAQWIEMKKKYGLGK